MIRLFPTVQILGVTTAFVVTMIGGVIVNIYLGKYRMTEYQIVSIHYLVVGIVFVASLVITIGFWPLLIGVFVAALRNLVGPPVSIVAAVVSAVASVGISVWAALQWKLSERLKRSRFIPRLIHILQFLFPVSVALRLIVPSFTSGVLDWERQVAFSLVFLALVAYIYDYASRIYGVPIDDITDSIGGGMGRGIPRLVQFTGTKDDMKLLAQLGIRIKEPQVSDEIYLIDETGNYFIVTNTLEADSEAIKVSKNIVKAIRYKILKTKSS